MSKSVRKINNLSANYIQYYGNLNQWNTNFIFSSPSLYILIKILQLAASSQTNEELQNFTLTDDDDNEIYKQLQNNINEIVEINNHLFIKHLPKEKYNEEISKLYDSGVKCVDFSNIPKTIELIDKWIFDATKGLILDVMKNCNCISINTVAILVSTLYFKGQWKYPFSKYNLKNEEFYLDNDTKINTIYMHHVENHKYLENLEYKMLEMPYSNERYSAIFVLPNSNEITKNNLDFNKILTDIEKLLQTDSIMVKVKIPKFSFENTINWKSYLNTDLKTLFDQNLCDLSKMSDFQIYVTEIIQSLKIQVDENGTVAAAATIAIMNRTSLIYEEEKFEATHPFFVFIYDKEIKVLLFSGFVKNPNKN